MTVRVESNPTGPLTADYNPYLTSSALTQVGATSMIYEPLLQFDGARPSAVTPWLATAYRWGDAGRSLTFTIRNGVRWSDGVPLTAADVAFSLELVVRHPILEAIGTAFTTVPISAVTTPTPDTVTVELSQVGTPYLQAVASIPIVPKHIWSSVDPLTFTNPHPVGTGPFLFDSGSAQGLKLVRNPHYWQAGLPRVAGLYYPAYDSNTSANLALEQGQLDWTSNFVPEIKRLFVDRSPATNHYWFPSIGDSFLCPNLGKPMFDPVAVRRAISLALDRSVISRTGELGEQPPAQSPTGLPLPLFQSSIDPSLARSSYGPADPTKAKQVLRQAGFHFTSSGALVQPNGRPFAFTLVGPSSWTDTMADYQVIAEELKAIGMDVTIQGVSASAFVADLSLGTYDMAECAPLGVSNSSPYFAYESLLDGSGYQPDGKPTFSDFERWHNSFTDALLKAWRQATTPAARQTAIDDLEQIMVSQVPVIPILQSVAWSEFSTARVTGFPTAADPYALGSADGLQAEVVALHLRPVR